MFWRVQGLLKILGEQVPLAFCLLIALFCRQGVANITPTGQRKGGQYLRQCNHLNLEPGTQYNAYEIITVGGDVLECCLCPMGHYLNRDCNSSNPNTTECLPCIRNENEKTYMNQEGHYREKCHLDFEQCPSTMVLVEGSASQMSKCICPVGTVERDRGCHPTPKPPVTEFYRPSVASATRTATPKTSQAPIMEKVSSVATPKAMLDYERISTYAYVTEKASQPASRKKKAKQTQTPNNEKKDESRTNSPGNKNEPVTQRSDKKKEDDDSLRGVYAGIVLGVIAGIVLGVIIGWLCRRTNQHDRSAARKISDEEQSTSATSSQMTMESNSSNLMSSFQRVSETPPECTPFLSNSSDANNATNETSAVSSENCQDAERSVALTQTEPHENMNEAQRENGSITDVRMSSVAVRYSPNRNTIQQHQQNQQPNRTSQAERQKVRHTLSKMSEVINRRDLFPLSRKLLPLEHQSDIEDMEHKHSDNTKEMAAQIFIRVTECVSDLTLMELSHHVQSLGYLRDIVTDALQDMGQLQAN